ncbi:MAG: RNA pseudouridine synthase [Treponema sp.]|nr:MAG: RNA pseudouridine synthase [Treponema sp.]
MSDVFVYADVPKIISETADYAVLYKPRGMPTAPLNWGEEGTLLAWFLKQRPEAADVIGKKDVEAGLIHRLDTATTGLVLISKNQKIYDAFQIAQGRNFVKKTYTAICNSSLQALSEPVDLPHTITSQFRPFGRGGKMVLPVFYGMRHFSVSNKMYSTTITNISEANDLVFITCTLTQGYRHQVRAHLRNFGCPIYGDALYNDMFQPEINDEDIKKHDYPLQLFATGLSFPESLTCGSESFNYVSFSLPAPEHPVL